MRKLLHYLDERNLTVRQGHQLWHLHQALKRHPEEDVISGLAAEYRQVGRVKTIAEGMVLAGAFVTAYRSTEAAERVPQRMRDKLDNQGGQRHAPALRLDPAAGRS